MYHVGAVRYNWTAKNIIQVSTGDWKFTFYCSSFHHNRKFGKFTILYCSRGHGIIAKCVLQVPRACLFLFDQSDTIFLALSLSLSKPKFPISSMSDQKAWYQVNFLYNYSYSFKSKLILNETVGLSQIKQNKNQRLMSIKKNFSLS